MNKYHKVAFPLSAALGIIFLIILLAFTSDIVPVGQWLQQIHKPAHSSLAAKEDSRPPGQARAAGGH